MIRILVVPAMALAIAGPCFAQATTMLSYTCNLDGAPAQLTAQVEAINDAGIVYNGPDITGVIGTGLYKLRYGGQLVSNTARYVFTGEDAYADFTDMTTNARFRVQFIIQGPQLMLVANPEGPQPTRYLCTSAPARQ